MHEEQRQNLGAGRHVLGLRVDEVQVEAGHIGLELRQRVQEGLTLPPVVVLAPKLDNLRAKNARRESSALGKPMSRRDVENNCCDKASGNLLRYDIRLAFSIFFVDYGTHYDKNVENWRNF